MTYFHSKSIYDAFPKTEIDFFNLIKDNVQVIFDIGCRDDIDYVKNSFDKSREFHLFDPDPDFIRNCQKQIESLEDLNNGVENGIYLNCFGVGAESGEMTYYPNTQSFIFRTHHATSQDVGLKFEIKTLDEYCLEKSISNIDFLKIDIEGMEIDVLNGGKNIVNNSTKIIQFEFASTMLDRGVDPDQYVGWFDKQVFDLYLQRVDPRHPYYSNNLKMLTPLTDDLYQIIKEQMNEGSGCNLIAIRKEHSKIYKNLF
jgi:FkbM family methyltransferase